MIKKEVDMKLAEALCIRADLQKRSLQLEERIKSVAKIQEGDEPDEMPEDLFAELHSTMVQLQDIVFRINATNMRALCDGIPITQMIARKDALSWEINILRNVLKVASSRESRYSRNEIKYVKTVDVLELRKKVDRMSAELRKLDLKIQESNWTVELESED